MSDYVIFYADGTTAKNETPSYRGVIAIVQLAENGSPYEQSGADFYVRVDEPGCYWRAMDAAGVYDWLVENDLLRPGLAHHLIRTGEVWESADIFGIFAQMGEQGLVLLGRTVGNKAYEQIMAAVEEMRVNGIR